MRQRSRVKTQGLLVIATGLAILSSLMVSAPAGAQKPGPAFWWVPQPALVMHFDQYVTAACDFTPTGMGRGTLRVAATGTAQTPTSTFRVECHLEGHYGGSSDGSMYWDKVNADAGVSATGIGVARASRTIQFAGEDITRVRRVCVRASYSPGRTFFGLRPGPTGTIGLKCGAPVQQAFFPRTPGGPPV